MIHYFSSLFGIKKKETCHVNLNMDHLLPLFNNQYCMQSSFVAFVVAKPKWKWNCSSTSNFKQSHCRGVEQKSGVYMLFDTFSKNKKDTIVKFVRLSQSIQHFFFLLGQITYHHRTSAIFFRVYTECKIRLSNQFLLTLKIRYVWLGEDYQVLYLNCWRHLYRGI